MSLETSMKPAFGDNEGFRGERIPDPVLAVPIQTQMTFFLQNTKFDNLINVQWMDSLQWQDIVTHIKAQ